MLNVDPILLHNMAIGITIALGSMGGAFGQGIAAQGSLEGICRQPNSQQDHFRTLFIGLVLIESGPVTALICSMMMFLSSTPVSVGSGIAMIGAGFLMGITSFLACLASGRVVHAAAQSIARQPFIARNIFSIMILAQAIIEAPIIFAFIVTSILQHLITDHTTMIQGVQLCAASLALALGSVGPAIGQALFAAACCTAIGLKENIHHKIFPFMLLNQTLIDTPLIFSLLFSFIIMYTPIPPTADLIGIIPLIMAAVTIGLGSIGSGIGIGYTASRSAYQIAADPAQYNSIFKTTLLSAMFIESSTIYAMIVALSLIIKIM